MFGFWRELPWGYRPPTPRVSSQVREGASSLVTLTRAVILSTEAPPSRPHPLLITSPRPCPPAPSHCGVGFQQLTKTCSLEHTAYELSSNISQGSLWRANQPSLSKKELCEEQKGPHAHLSPGPLHYLLGCPLTSPPFWRSSSPDQSSMSRVCTQG